MANSEDAVRRLEDAVDIMTDMAHIRRNSRTKDDDGHMIISPTLVKEAIEGFNLFDRDGNAGLDISELATVFRALGQNPTDAELRDILKKFDINHNGRLERDEFEQMVQSYMKPMWQVKEELKDAFRIFDKDGNGLIDTSELENVLKKYGEPLTHRQSKELISLMDKNRDGRVDMDDFVKFLCEVDEPHYFQKHYPHDEKPIPDASGRTTGTA
ncbi:calmodulin-A-like [Mya arenaria]|uniref:calmodulin-A-like n=1 Tax=Mya arenaria TaxID=6604 RepID=UPI0022E1F104|nr:calmodulin-A-like [Mya arenaria]